MSATTKELGKVFAAAYRMRTYDPLGAKALEERARNVARLETQVQMAYGPLDKSVAYGQLRREIERLEKDMAILEFMQAPPPPPAGHHSHR